MPFTSTTPSMPTTPRPSLHFFTIPLELAMNHSASAFRIWFDAWDSSTAWVHSRERRLLTEHDMTPVQLERLNIPIAWNKCDMQMNDNNLWMMEDQQQDQLSDSRHEPKTNYSVWVKRTRNRHTTHSILYSIFKLDALYFSLSLPPPHPLSLYLILSWFISFSFSFSFQVSVSFSLSLSWCFRSWNTAATPPSGLAKLVLFETLRRNPGRSPMHGKLPDQSLHQSDKHFRSCEDLNGFLSVWFLPSKSPPSASFQQSIQQQLLEAKICNNSNRMSLVVFKVTRLFLRAKTINILPNGRALQLLFLPIAADFAIELRWNHVIRHHNN